MSSLSHKLTVVGAACKAPGPLWNLVCGIGGNGLRPVCLEHWKFRFETPDEPIFAPSVKLLPPSGRHYKLMQARDKSLSDPYDRHAIVMDAWKRQRSAIASIVCPIMVRRRDPKRIWRYFWLSSDSSSAISQAPGRLPCLLHGRRPVPRSDIYMKGASLLTYKD